MTEFTALLNQHQQSRLLQPSPENEDENEEEYEETPLEGEGSGVAVCLWCDSDNDCKSDSYEELLGHMQRKHNFNFDAFRKENSTSSPLLP